MRDLSDSDTVSWKACPEDSYRFSAWDDECVVYHRPSGTTHFLNSSSLYLIRDALQEPKTTRQVAMVFCPGDTSDDAEFIRVQREILFVLGHLEHIGLIERL